MNNVLHLAPEVDPHWRVIASSEVERCVMGKEARIENGKKFLLMSVPHQSLEHHKATITDGVEKSLTVLILLCCSLCFPCSFEGLQHF